MLPFGDDENHPVCVRLKRQLRFYVERLIAQGCTHFITGMSQGIDTFFAELVIEYKGQHPELTLECALPSERQTDNWLERDRNRYYRIIENCNQETYLSNYSDQESFVKRNEYMIERADVLLVVGPETSRSLMSLIDQAREKAIPVYTINLL